MGVAYTNIDSGLVEGCGDGAWQAGCRSPELYLRRPGREAMVRLYELVRYGQWGVVTVPEGQERGKDETSDGRQVARLRLLDHVTDFTDNLLKRYDGEILEFDLDVNIGAVLVVIRPDLYIGYVGDSAGAEKYLSSVA